MNRNECYKKAGLLAALTLCLSLILFAAGAAAETEGDFTYTVSDGCATITNYDGFSTVTIPETLGGYPVTAIGSFAFSHDYITSVTMPDSVVSIGDYAFYNRTSLSSVTFGSGVVSIGSSAFNKCSALTEIVIPDSVTTLGTDAFYGCTKLASVTLGSGLTAIPSHTFYGCSALTSISIPAGVTSIGSWAFYDCTALEDVYTPSLAAWLSIEFENYCATPMYYADNLYVGNALLTNAVIPEGTASINNWAFYNCASLTSVSIPASVTSIGVDAFYKCSALEKVHVPTLDAWLGIEFPVSSANPLRYASSLYIAGALLTDAVIPDGVTAINDYAFYSYDQLATLSIPQSTVSIGKSAFYDCTSLRLISLHDNIETIGEAAFHYGSGMLYASIGTKTAKAISASGSVFVESEYSSLSLKYDDMLGLCVTNFARDKTSVVVPEGVESISSSAFKSSSIVSITLPSTLKSIPDSAFYGCSALTSITIPDSVSSIGKEAFENCSKLASITLGSGLTSIGADAFYNCSKLKKVYVPTLEAWMDIQFADYWSTPMLYADDLYVGGSPLKSVVIPEGVTRVDACRFQNCKSLASITLPSTLTSIGQRAFSGCNSIKEVHIPTLSAWLGITLEGSSNNPLRDGYAEDRTLYIGGSPLTHLVIPDGVTAIDTYRFHSCKTLVSVDFPDSVTSIGYEAFEGCSNLKSVTLPDSVHTVDSYAFNCSSSCEITLPDNITKIGTFSPFGYGIVLVNPDSATFVTLSDLGNDFRYCDKTEGEWVYLRKEDGTLYADGYRGKATELTFPENVTGINSHFYEYVPNRSLVTSVRIPEGIRYIGGNALLSFPSLNEIYLHDGIQEMGMYPFEMNQSGDNPLTIYCSKNSVTARNLSNAHEEYVFCDLSDPDWLWRYDDDSSLMLGGYRGKATSITLPAGTTTIADSAFGYKRDEKLRSIVIPEGYESIGDWAFDGCENLAHISLPSTLHVIGESAFWGIDLTTIQLPEGLTIIGENAFSACWDLESLTIPSTVTRIEKPIMEDSNLTTVVLPREIEYIAPGAFGESLSTVYCYRGTYAQEWAKDNAPLVRLIGEGTLEDLVELSMPEYYEDQAEYFVFEVGNTFPFMAGVSVGTLPFDANYTFTCTSSNPSVARVDGDLLTFLKPGTATITIGIAERPDVAKLTRTIEVFNPVTSFTVPDAVFVHIDAEDPAYITPENIEPAKDANPYFRRVDVGDVCWSWKSIEDRGVRFWPEDRLGAIKCEIESFSGVSQPILFVTYDKIGEVYAQAPAKALTVGEIYEPDVTVMVDGAELEKLSYLYTLKSSNAKVAAITEDEMIRAVAPGTATITVTARNSGKTAKFTVTVIHSVLLDLPSSLKSIGEEAFAGVSAGEIRIPDGCTSIGARAFAGCENLYEVTIPASVTEIADDAFDGCSGVNIIAPEGSAGQQAANDNGFTFTAM